jgi:hypothetical protein
MKAYRVTPEGLVTRQADGAGIPLDARNVDYQGYLAWVAQGNQPDPAPVPPPPSARDRRAIAYRDQLGKESGDFVKTIGDILDALIRAHYGDTADLDVIANKIIAIKQAIPAS